MGYKEALKRHRGDLGYSEEQIAEILDGVQEPEGLSWEDKERLDLNNPPKMVHRSICSILLIMIK